MTRKEAKEVFLNRGFVNGLFDGNKWRQSCVVISKWLEQEPCEDEYIKVPKKALKYRTAGMVVYNAEWLKNHFDIERAVICGAQEPCEGRMKYVQETVNTIMDSCKTDSIKDKCFRNAARFIQNAIDGSSPEFELINDAEPCEDCIKIPEGATNGEVFEKLMREAYPKMLTIYKRNDDTKTIVPIFNEEWWNSPYRKEQE